MLRRARGRRESPLADIRRRILPFVPAVAGLGLLASILEGAGIGLFVPLLALMLDDTASTSMPEPLRAAAKLFSGAGFQERILLFGAGHRVDLSGIVYSAVNVVDPKGKG